MLEPEAALEVPVETALAVAVAPELLAVLLLPPLLLRMPPNPSGTEGAGFLEAEAAALAYCWIFTVVLQNQSQDDFSSNVDERTHGGLITPTIPAWQ